MATSASLGLQVRSTNRRARKAAETCLESPEEQTIRSSLFVRDFSSANLFSAVTCVAKPSLCFSLSLEFLNWSARSTRIQLHAMFQLSAVSCGKVTLGWITTFSAHCAFQLCGMRKLVRSIYLRVPVFELNEIAIRAEGSRQMTTAGDERDMGSWCAPRHPRCRGLSVGSRSRAAES